MEVSVIIPVYNAEKYIEKAINSCLLLDEVKEIVVVDDGYEDNAVEIIKSLQKKHLQIKLYAHPGNENRGAGASRNLGLQNASMEWVAFLDADDFFLENRFREDIRNLAQYPDAEGFYNAIGSYFYSDEAKEIFQKSGIYEVTTMHDDIKNAPAELFDRLLGIKPSIGYFSLDGFTVKKSSLDKQGIRFNEDLRLHQDTDFLMKCAYHLNLLPSNILRPVSLRGVHEENRITSNYLENTSLKSKNRVKMWQSILSWAKENRLGKEYLEFIKNEINFYELMSAEIPKTKNFLLKSLNSPAILKHNKYLQLHKYYFGDLRYSNLLFRMRNFVIQFL